MQLPLRFCLFCLAAVSTASAALLKTPFHATPSPENLQVAGDLTFDLAADEKSNHLSIHLTFTAFDQTFDLVLDHIASALIDKDASAADALSFHHDGSDAAHWATATLMNNRTSLNGLFARGNDLYQLDSIETFHPNRNDDMTATRFAALEASAAVHGGHLVTRFRNEKKKKTEQPQPQQQQRRLEEEDADLFSGLTATEPIPGALPGDADPSLVPDLQDDANYEGANGGDFSAQNQWGTPVDWKTQGKPEKWNDCHPDENELTAGHIILGIDTFGISKIGGGKQAARDMVAAMMTNVNMIFKNQFNIVLKVPKLLMGSELGNVDLRSGGSCGSTKTPTSIDRRLKLLYPLSRSQRGMADSKNALTMHLLSGCYHTGYMGVAALAQGSSVCGQVASGVNGGVHDKNRGWLTLVHELGHNFGASHTFQTSCSNKKGIMNYGKNDDLMLNGRFQFNPSCNKRAVCRQLKYLWTSKCKPLPTLDGGNGGAFGSAAPTPSPTPCPANTACPTPAPTPGCECKDSDVANGRCTRTSSGKPFCYVKGDASSGCSDKRASTKITGAFWSRQACDNVGRATPAPTPAPTPAKPDVDPSPAPGPVPGPGPSPGADRFEQCPTWAAEGKCTDTGGSPRPWNEFMSGYCRNACAALTSSAPTAAPTMMMPPGPGDTLTDAPTPMPTTTMTPPGPTTATPVTPTPTELEGCPRWGGFGWCTLDAGGTREWMWEKCPVTCKDHLPVPPPDLTKTFYLYSDSFCRTADGGEGVFQLTLGDEAQCGRMCTEDDTCTGFEVRLGSLHRPPTNQTKTVPVVEEMAAMAADGNGTYVCEIHTAPLSRARSKQTSEGASEASSKCFAKKTHALGFLNTAGGASAIVAAVVAAGVVVFAVAAGLIVRLRKVQRQTRAESAAKDLENNLRVAYEV